MKTYDWVIAALATLALLSVSDMTAWIVARIPFAGKQLIVFLHQEKPVALLLVCLGGFAGFIYLYNKYGLRIE